MKPVPIFRPGWVESLEHVSLGMESDPEGLLAEVARSSPDGIKVQEVLLLQQRKLARREAEQAIYTARAMAQSAAEAIGTAAATSHRGPWMPATRALLDVDSASLWLPVTDPEEYAARRRASARQDIDGGVQAKPGGGTLLKAEFESTGESFMADMLAIGMDEQAEIEQMATKPCGLQSGKQAWRQAQMLGQKELPDPPVKRAIRAGRPAWLRLQTQKRVLLAASQGSGEVGRKLRAMGVESSTEDAWLAEEKLDQEKEAQGRLSRREGGGNEASGTPAEAGAGA